MDTNILNAIAEYGIKVLIVAFLTMIAIGLLKPLVRKKLNNDKARHAIYQGLDIAFVAVFSFVAQACVGFNAESAGKLIIASYTLVNLLYPLYANLSVQELFCKGAKLLATYLQSGKQLSTIGNEIAKDIPAELPTNEPINEIPNGEQLSPLPVEEGEQVANSSADTKLTIQSEQSIGSVVTMQIQPNTGV